MSKLICIGELIIDFQSVGTASLVDTKQFVRNAGGAPANVCVQAKKLNVESIYLSQVGNDSFGQFLINTLNDLAINTSYIFKSPDYDTSLAFVSFGADGEREFSFYRRTAADLHFNEKLFSNVEFNENDILEFGSVALGTKENQAVHLELIERARKNNAFIAFDPNLRFNLWDDLQELKAVCYDFMKLADVIKVGEDELEFITGKQIEAGVKEVLSYQAKLVLVTKGSKGATLYLKNGKVFNNYGYTVNAVDTTGAGDATFGGFLATLIKNNMSYLNLNDDTFDYQGAVDFACVCGAYTTTGYGAIPAIGDEKTLERVGKIYGNS